MPEGKLIYQSHTRPDISYVMSIVNQFMQASYKDHMEVVNRILRYLKATPCKGLKFRKTDKRCIDAYTDSDWARHIVDRNPPKNTTPLCWAISLLGEARSKELWLEVALKLNMKL